MHILYMFLNIYVFNSLYDLDFRLIRKSHVSYLNVHVMYFSFNDDTSKIGQCENTVEPLSLLTAGYKRKNTNVMLITSPYNMWYH